MYLIIKINPNFYEEDYNEVILGLQEKQALKFYPLFNSGKKINTESPLIFESGSDLVLAEKYLKLDLLPANPLLVSAKFGVLIKNHCNDSIELIPAVIKNGSKIHANYYAINILKVVDCIDFSRSDVYRMLPSDPSSPLVINRVIFKDGGLHGVDIATAKDGAEFSLASIGFSDLCRKQGITGIDFFPNEISKN